MRVVSLLFIGLLVLTGCVSSSVNTSRTRVVSIKSAFPNKVPVVINPVRDRREDQSRVGVAKNGYNIVLYDLSATDDVVTWIYDSVVESLEEAGATVVTEMQPGAVVIDLSLRELFAESNPGFSSVEFAAKIVVDAEVLLPDGRAFSRRFGGLSKDTYYFILSSDLFERHVHKATDRALHRLVSALRALIVKESASR